jgi:hypothetical protein
VKNNEALKRTEVRLITRNPTPKGMGMYIVGMHSPWIKLSHVGNLFGSVLSMEADWRVMTPTMYGDNRRISPMIDFLSNFPIFFGNKLVKNPNFLLSDIFDFVVRELNIFVGETSVRIIYW